MDDYPVLLSVLGLVAWVFFCFVVRHEAEVRGRSTAAYFWLSFFFSPIVGGIALGLQGPAPAPPGRVILAHGRDRGAVTGDAERRPAR